MKHKSLFVSAAMLCMMLAGCEKTPEIGSNTPTTTQSAPTTTPQDPTFKQIDITVLVPVHASSLKYFDYVICYTDNLGQEYRDTITKETGGIVVEDWVNEAAKLPFSLADSKTSLNTESYHVTFHYQSLPILCNCMVELVPRVADDSVASFKFINPKPYIYSHIYFSTSSIPDTEPEITNIECSEIDIHDMSIGAFMKIYGRHFVSCYQISSHDGYIDTTFY